MSGAIVDLSKAGNLGIGSNGAYASLGYSGTVRFSLCHGLDLGIQGSATAEAGVSQQVLDYLQATVEIEAGIAAGVRLTAKLSPTVLDEVGLVASVQAYLKAYVQASLELSLTMDKILQGVRRETDQTTYLIFRDFAERLEVGAGVQANVQIAITAAAEVVCQGRLVAGRGEHEKPGFDLRMNAEAGFLFGAGIDFFAMARLNDLTGFFRNAKDLLLDHIRGEGEAKTSLSERQLDVIFQAWSTAIDLIIDGSLGPGESPLQALANSGRRFTTQFVMDEFLAAYDRLLDTLFDDAVDALEQQTGFSAEDLDQLLLALQDLESRLPNISVFHDLLPALDSLQAIHQSLGLPNHALLQQAVTHLYMFGYLLDTPNRAHYQDLPDYVRVRYQHATGQSLQRLDNPQQAYLYLENGCLADWLRDFSGLNNTPAGEFLDLLARRNLSLAGVLHLLLDGDADGDRQLVAFATDLLEGLFNQVVTPAVDNIIKPILDDTPLGANYYESVIENTIRGFPTLFTALLRDYVDHPDDKDKLGNLRYICNRYLLVLFSKNVSFFCGELLTFSADNVSNSVAAASNNIRYGRFRNMARDMFRSVEDRIEDLLPFPVRIDIEQSFMDELIEATEDFMLDIFAIADRAMGRSTWTQARISKLTGALEGMLLNPDDDHLDFGSVDSAALQSLIDQITDCSFLPSANLDSLTDLAEVMSAIGLRQFKEFLFDMPVKTALFFVRLLKILLVKLIEEVLEFIESIIDGIKAGLEAALAALEALINELQQIIAAVLDEIEDLLAALYDQTLGALADFFDNLLADLDFADLSWVGEILEWLGELFGGQSDADKARSSLLNLKRQALDNMNEGAFKAALRNMALDGEYSNEEYSRWLDLQVLTPRLREQLGKMKFKSSQAVFRKRSDAFQGVFETNRRLSAAATTHRARSNQLIRSRADVRSKERELDALRARDNDINALRASDIRINSPLMVDAANDDLPLYGEHVLLEIDFDQVDIRRVIARQFPIVTAEFQDPANRRLYTSLPMMRVRSTATPLSATSPLNLKILINGHEVALDQVEVKGNHVLRLHLGRPLIRKGQNELYVVLAAPPGRAESFIAYRQFMCDDNSKQWPSNTVYIDPEHTVIDSDGDDHHDARRSGYEDKERVVITNASDKAVHLDGWRLSDAAGHEYVFRGVSLKPGSRHAVYVGEVPFGEGWIGHHSGRVIALLNNKGEFLKLTDNNGKVVSQLYTGNPNTIKHIRIYRGATQ